MVELHLIGVRVELPANQPVVLLQEAEGERILPIWIGTAEATSIALAQQGVVPARPMTHDLMKNILDELGILVERIVITELRDSTYFAVIQMARNGTRYEISSRPSDAIALAVRSTIPIFASEEVLSEASIIMPEEPEEQAEEVEKFREFLESVDPEDFRE